MTGRRVYLETMGCQMNVLDSELVMGRLREMGYAAVAAPADADVVLINTCSVRQHAEDKVWSRLGEVKRLKRRRPEMIIGVIGCMAARDRQGLLERAPHVDVICGPTELNKVPGMIASVTESRSRQVAVQTEMSRRLPVLERSQEFDTLEALDLSRTPAPGQSTLQAYIRVQRGCDKFCTFCVVPFTRGRERCRPPGHIVREARALADGGCVEITLLGQTVNSYAYDEDGKPVRFADLLARVADVDGIERARFVTSYPGDFSDDIFDVMREHPRVCEYLHIPAQSGSDDVLRRMKRQYTVAQYDELIGRARERVPGISLAGDFIVGFSGETDEDFRRTVELVERTQYKNIFCFKYSERPGTAADRNLPDDIPEATKRARNVELLAVQEAISLASNRRLIGETMEVLVEGPSKAARKATRHNGVGGGNGKPCDESSTSGSLQLMGRTRGDQIVVFEGNPSMIGSVRQVKIAGATPLTLCGAVSDLAASPVTALSPLTG